MKDFQYQIETTIRGYYDELRDGLFIYNSCNRFDSDPKQKARYEIVTDDNKQTYLKMVSGVFDQKKLSGRYWEEHKSLTNYKFGMEMLPSYEPGITPGIFGALFWFLDENHYYYVGWDGGQYNWGANSLRIYRFLNGSYTLVKSFPVGPYQVNKRYKLEVELKDKNITITIDDNQVYSAYDSMSWNKGAYGPAGAGQPITFYGIKDYKIMDFIVQKTFEDNVSNLYYNEETSKKITLNGVHSLMSEAIENFKTTKNLKEIEIKTYQVSSLTSGVFVFFNKNKNQTITTNGLDDVYAYLDVTTTYTPQAPLNFKGTPLNAYAIEWTWDDVENEDGYTIYDTEGNVLAVLPANTQKWVETGLSENTLYTRVIKSYKQMEYSSASIASAKTLEEQEEEKIPTPLNMSGETVDSTTIFWSWEYENKENYVFYVYDEKGSMVNVVDGEVNYTETNLKPNTLHKRYVVAKDKEKNILSLPSNIAEARTEEIPEEEIVEVIDSPFELYGVALDNHSIEWSWSYEGESHQGFILYDAIDDTIIAVIHNKDTRSYVEKNLQRQTTYYRYIVAFNDIVESDKSNIAEATTLSLLTEEVIIEEEEWWDPSQIQCIRKEREDEEYLKAFQSGVGDNLDLMVKLDENEIKEEFTFETQVIGIKKEEIEVYPKREFEFRFKAKGKTEKISNSGEYELKVIAYPPKYYEAKVKAKIEVPEKTKYRYIIFANGKKEKQIPKWFSYKITKDLLINKTYTWDVEEWILNGYDLFGNWSLLEGNRIYCAKEKFSYAIYPSMQLSQDISLKSKINTQSLDGKIGVIIRATKNTKEELNGYVVYIDKDKIYLNKKVNGNEDELFSLNHSFGDGIYSFDVQVSCIEDVIFVSVKKENESIDFSVKDLENPFLFGTVGFVCENQEGTFSDFYLTEMYQEAVYTNERTVNMVNENENGWSSFYVLENNEYKQELNTKELETKNKYEQMYSFANIEVVSYGYYPVCHDEEVFLAIDSETEEVKGKIKTQTKEVKDEDVVIYTNWYEVDVYFREDGTLTKTSNEIEDMISFFVQKEKINKEYDSVVVLNTEIEKTNENVIYELRNGDLYFHSMIDTLYEGEETFSGYVYGYEGTKTVGSVLLINFKNKDGIVLDKKNLETIGAINFDIENFGEVEVNIQEEKLICQSAEKIEKTIKGFVLNGRNNYHLLHEIFDLSEINECHFELIKEQADENIWYLWKSKNTQTFKESIISTTKDVIVVGAEYKLIEEDFVLEGEWTKGEVNGKKPMNMNLSGKRSLRVPIDIELPDNAKDVVYGVEIKDNSPEDIVVTFENNSEEYGKTSSTPYYFDVARFNSDYKEKIEIERKWFGTKYRSNSTEEILKDELKRIKTECFNPLKELKEEEVKEIESFYVVVRSHNENVKTWVDEKEHQKINWNNKDDMLLPISIYAKLINHTQTNWYPKIHNGYYYFNEKEHYLYSETNIEEAYKENQTYEVNFKYLIEIVTKITNEDKDKEINHTEGKDFSGIYFNTVNRNGMLSLEAKENIHYDFGYYISQEVFLGLDYEKQEWSEVKEITSISWDEEDVGLGDSSIQLSSVSVYLQTQNKDGSWNEWEKINNGSEIKKECETFRYRVEFKAGKEKESELDFIVDEGEENFYKGNLSSNSNLLINKNGEIQMMTEKPYIEENKFISRPLEVKEGTELIEEVTAYIYLPGNKKKPKFLMYVATKDSVFIEDWKSIDTQWVQLDIKKIKELENDYYEIKFKANIENPKKYIRYQIRFIEAGEQIELKHIEHKEFDDFYQEEAKAENIEISNDLKLQLNKERGTYISEPIYIGKYENKGKIKLRVEKTFDGKSVRVYTNTASSKDRLTENITRNINWTEVSLTEENGYMIGEIESIPLEWMAYRLDFESGLTETKIINIKNIEKEDYEGGEFTNTKFNDLTKEIELQDVKKNGTYISPVYEFPYLEEWGTFSIEFDENNGEIKCYIETSNDKENWLTAEVTEIDHRMIFAPIQNSVAPYMRYRVELKPSEQITLDSIYGKKLKTSNGMFKSYVNIEGNEISNSDGLNTGVYVSPVYDLKNITNFNKFSFQKETNKNGKIEVYTRTCESIEANDWEDWKLVGSNGTIYSTPKRYLQFQVRLRPGVKTSDIKKEIEIVKKDGFTSYWKENKNPLDETNLLKLSMNNESLYIPVEFVTNESDWYYYDTDVIDMEANVLSFDNISLNFSYLPEEINIKDNVKVFVATSKTRNNIEGNVFTEGRFIELDYIGNNKYKLMTQQNFSFMRILIGMKVGKGKPEAVIRSISTNGTKNKTNVTGDTILLSGKEKQGSYVSPSIHVGLLNNDLSEFHYWTRLLYEITEPYIGGSVKIEYQTFDSTPNSTWTEDLNSLDKTKPFMRFRVTLKSGYSRNEEKLYSVRFLGESMWESVGGYLKSIQEIIGTKENESYQIKIKYEDNTESDWIRLSKDVVGLYNDKEIVAFKLKSTSQEEENIDIVGLITQYESPKVKIHGIEGIYQKRKSAYLEAVRVHINENQYEVHTPSKIKEINIEYYSKQYKSPTIKNVMFSCKTKEKQSPIVDSVSFDFETYKYVFPRYKKTQIITSKSFYQTKTPKVKNIKIKGILKGKEEKKYYFIENEGTIPHDLEWHLVNEKTIQTIVDLYMNEQPLKENEKIESYRMISLSSGVELITKNNEGEITKEDGFIYGKTNLLARDLVFEQSKVKVKNNEYAFITPIPEQGSPVIVLDEIGPMNRVSFYDEKGNPTLDFEEIIISEGRKEITLSWFDIDVDTLEVYVDEKGKNEWKRINKFVLCENILHLSKAYKYGTKIKVRYRIYRSFTINHNFNIKDNISQIILHKPILGESQSIKVYAETNKQTAYYKAKEVNLNPLKRFENHGFIYITNELTKANEIQIYLPKDNVYANGKEFFNIIVRVIDENKNPVVNEELLIDVFGIPSSCLLNNHGFTNESGIFSVLLNPIVLNYNQDIFVEVYARKSNIKKKQKITLQKELSKPVISLWAEKEIIKEHEKEVVIYVKLTNTEQKAISNAPIYFESSHGYFENISSKTNYYGIAKSKLLIPKLNNDELIEITCQSVDYNVKNSLRVYYKM
ncbi:MAG: Ig-like domain-containing protein [Ignavibacterium sp.]|nr:Ig-like domain-containing protein [Ignavibacterium sp.]